MERKREIPQHVQQQLKEKRFVLSREEFSEKRFDGFRKVFESLKQAYPEIISAHVFGSMTKGYATPQSDIDIFLFVQDEKQDENRLLALETEFKWALDTRLNIPYSNLEMVMVNQNFYDGLMKRVKGADEGSDLSEAEWIELAKPFIGVSIGDSSEIRKRILEKLANFPNGNGVWKNIVNYVRLFEHNLINFSRGPDSEADRYIFSTPRISDTGEYKNLYPQTVQDAFLYYVERKPFRGKK